MAGEIAPAIWSVGEEIAKLGHVANPRTRQETEQSLLNHRDPRATASVAVAYDRVELGETNSLPQSR